MDSGCDSGAAAVDTGADNADCGKAGWGKAGTTGNGAVDGSDGAALPGPAARRPGRTENPAAPGARTPGYQNQLHRP